MNDSKVKKSKNMWGPPIWATIHILAATLRPENGEAYKNLLFSLTKLLPCDYCRDNLLKKLTDHPPDKYLRNNHDAFFYSYLLHDLANQHITEHTPPLQGGDNPSDPKISPPFDDVKAYYFNSLGEECKNCKT